MSFFIQSFLHELSSNGAHPGPLTIVVLPLPDPVVEPDPVKICVSQIIVLKIYKKKQKTQYSKRNVAEIMCYILNYIQLKKNKTLKKDLTAPCLCTLILNLHIMVKCMPCPFQPILPWQPDNIVT